MSNLLLLKYNNYFNRIVKVHDSLSEYIAEGKWLIYNNINFYKRDGVMTTQVLNNPSLKNGPVTSQTIGSIENCDYLVEYDNNGVILSRWFILESMQLRNGQYELSLKRDVMVDYKDRILDANCFIEKANVPNVNDVAIYNTEDISFNQIKESETLLKEHDDIPSWIIGYYAPLDEDVRIEATLTDINAVEVPSYDTWEYLDYLSNPLKKANSIRMRIYSNNEYESHTFTMNPPSIASVTTPTGFGGYVTTFRGSKNDFANYIMNNRDAIEGKVYEYDSYHKELPDINGKVFHFNTGSVTGYYRARLVRGTSSTDTRNISKSSNISVSINGILRLYQYAHANDNGESNISYDVDYTGYTIRLERVDVETIAFTLPETANTLNDAPYKMFAIPYGRCKTVIGGVELTLGSEESAKALASEIALKLGTFLYDIQLLPYFPWREKVNDGAIVMSNDANAITKVKNNSDVDRSIVIYPPYSSFTLDVNYEIRLSESVVGRKITGQCDTYRIVSPNYAAAFEFNPLKTGEITKINIDCTYKPLSPYIHINPNWNGLYGRDFDDTRGLIVQGDFSIPVVNSAWIQYQINNKNYLNSFNRNIESIELRNRFSRFQDIANATVGTAGGALMGAKMGGGVGAAVGGIASAVGGIADVGVNEILRRDSLDLTKDQFNYSLENIEALPNTLAKVSSYDYNNKIFPIVEHYTCTDKEKDIFAKKMEFNGMKIMRIDRIANFITSTRQYIKAQLIRIDIDEDAHVCNEIANELYKGVYL